jgi:hypothetical protein
VVVDDGHVAGVVVVQLDRRIVLQQKVIGDERLRHSIPFHWRMDRGPDPLDRGTRNKSSIASWPLPLVECGTIRK